MFSTNKQNNKPLLDGTILQLMQYLNTIGITIQNTISVTRNNKYQTELTVDTHEKFFSSTH